MVSKLLDDRDVGVVKLAARAATRLADPVRHGEGQAGKCAHERSRACGDGEAATAGEEHDHGHEESSQEGGWHRRSSRCDPQAQERVPPPHRCPPAP